MVAETAADVRRPWLTWGFAAMGTGQRDGTPPDIVPVSGWHRPEPALGGFLCPIRAQVLPSMRARCASYRGCRGRFRRRGVVRGCVRLEGHLW